eukprot:14505082-Alexandrium_andersonii.AAC.1
MQIRAPEAPREAQRLRRSPLKSGAPMSCRFRAAERAVRSVGRAGTTAPSGWILGPELTLTRGL